MENTTPTVEKADLKETTTDNAGIFMDRNNKVKVSLDDILAGKVTIEEAAEINKK